MRPVSETVEAVETTIMLLAQRAHASVRPLIAARRALSSQADPAGAPLIL